VEKLLQDVWIAEAVHQDDADAMAGMCALERRHILQFDGEADHFQTAFAIALWPEQKEVCPPQYRGAAELQLNADNKQAQSSCLQAVIAEERGQWANIDEGNWRHSRPGDTGQHLVLLLYASRSPWQCRCAHNWCISMQVVLVVRGTTSLADTLTDLSGHLVPFGGGGAEGDVPEGDVPQSKGAKPSDGRSSGDSTANSDGQVSSSRSGGEPASGKGNSSGAGSGDPSGAGRASAAADSSSSSDRREAGSSSSGGSSRQAREPEGMAHNGILRAAQSLLREQGPTLGELLRDNPGYRLKVGWKMADPIVCIPARHCH
jgi:hypothetical protein